MPLTGQQHYSSCLLRGNGRNVDRGWGNPLINGRHYPPRSGDRWCGSYGTSGGDNGGIPNDHYGGGSDSSSSSDFGRLHRHDQCTQQHEQFEQSMIAMSNSLIDLLKCQQRVQNNTIHVFQVIHQSQWDCTNDSLSYDIPTFDGKPESYFD